jgi:hypothetical protein
MATDMLGSEGSKGVWSELRMTLECCCLCGSASLTMKLQPPALIENALKFLA